MPKDKISPVDVEVGVRIKQAREGAGMTLAQVAEVADVSLQQVQKYEGGAARIYLTRLIDIAKAIGRPLGFFLKGLDALRK